MTMTLRAAVASAFMLLGLAPQALAQLPKLSEADDKAIHCIYDSFSDEDAINVANAEVTGEDKAVEAEAKAQELVNEFARQERQRAKTKLIAMQQLRPKLLCEAQHEDHSCQ